MARLESLARLRDSSPLILPSMLMCDFADLRGEVHRLEDAGAKALHLDVMDGSFVPNLTYGMPIVEAVRRHTELPLDVHLMISDPVAYLRPFQEAGADVITLHVEAMDSAAEAGEALQQIRELNVVAGLALNPATPLTQVTGQLAACDLLLVMSVKAGFGGQAFNPAALEKLRELQVQAGDGLLLEVDGGLNAETIPACAAAGASLFVVGSAIFRSSDYGSALRELTQLAESHQSGI